MKLLESSSRLSNNFNAFDGFACFIGESAGLGDSHEEKGERESILRQLGREERIRRADFDWLVKQILLEVLVNGRLRNSLAVELGYSAQHNLLVVWDIDHL
jgi:hypothetical protein